MADDCDRTRSQDVANDSPSLQSVTPVVNITPRRAAIPFGPSARLGLSFTTGLAAGAIAFAAMLMMSRYQLFFGLPDEVFPLLKRDQLSPEEIAFVSSALRTQAYQNTALTVAVFGAVVGGLLGLSSGVSRKSPLGSSVGLLGGVVAGAGAGALGGLVDLFTLERLWSMDFDHTYKAMIGHSSAFLIAGVGIGGMAGLAAQQVTRTLGVVLAAALIAGLIYPGLAAALFPVLNTDAAVPDGRLALLLWTVLPAGLMGLAIGRCKAALIPEAGSPGGIRH